MIRAPAHQLFLAALLFGMAGCGSARPARELRVCADPNNLPFSNERKQGFENRLAELIAGELRATVRYTWRPQRRGFIRNTLGAGVCDLVMTPRCVTCASESSWWETTTRIHRPSTR
jgi:mxaJ protein